MLQKATVLGLLAASHAEKQKPLVMSVSGGGLGSLTSGMAVARALKHLPSGDALSELTHLGGNSGGSWFNNLILHSESFYQKVTDETLPMDQLVNDWLHQHLDLMTAEVNGTLAEEFGRVDLQEAENGAFCDLANPIIRDVFKAVRNSQMLPERLLPLMAAPVLKEALAPKSAATATFEDFNHTLPGCTQISVTVLPPDAWTNYNADAGHNDANQLHATMKDGTQIDMAENDIGLPIAFVSDGPNKHNWFYNEDIAQLDISPKCPYTSKKKCKKAPYNPPEMTQLPLPQHPTIAEVMVASGSATCFASSPAIWNKMASGFNDWAMNGGLTQLCKHIPTLGPISKLIADILKPVCDLLAGMGDIVAKPVIKKFLTDFEACWPFGAQSLASPMMKEGVSVALSEESGVPFRYCDGAYAENTALPMTLAKVQRDCEQGLYDCSEPVKMILVNHGNITMEYQGPKKGLFGWGEFDWTNKPPLRALFADPTRPPSTGIDTFVPGIMTTVNVPSQTVFEEAFPEKPEWTEYLTMDVKTKTCRSCNFVDDPIRSLYKRSTLTTVENKWYGVKAGMKVDLLTFSLELPSPIWPEMFNEDAKKWSDPGLVLFGFGGAVDGRDSLKGHAPYAKAQLEAVAPVLEKFLNPSETAYV